MRWKKLSNLIVIIILCIAYTIVTLLNVIGPLHMNATGGMNPLGALSVYSILYLVIALSITWGVYFYWREKPELLFFTLILLGIVFIIAANFLWATMGS